MKAYFTAFLRKLPFIICIVFVLLHLNAATSSAQIKVKEEKPKKQKKKAKLPAEDITGVMLAEAQYNFVPSSLKGASITNPTSLQFGLDGRLYVSQQNGIIKAFTIVRNGPNDYSVTATETISLINGIPNYNDDGTLASSVTTRQVTGLLVAGTEANPILYVSSSDSRIGGPDGDKNLDTNSGIISRFTKTSSGWDKTDLIRGLPRSEENHANNGMQLDEQTNTLYIAVGGFTNAGSPSNNFAFICEYALGAAILSIDLNAIDAMPTIGTGNNKYKYNLPTLDDPTRANNPDGSDPGDPFGGNDGLNQAKIVAGGPVQIYSPGYRNAYDLVITKTPGKAGRMYTIDNGANQGWGGHPENEGAQGNVTNNYVSGEPGSNSPGPNDTQVNNLDNLHFIGNIATYVPGSHYGGHPTPIRANPAGAGLYTHSGTGVWRTSTTGSNPLPVDWPPLPLDKANPIEGDFQNPGETDLALLTFGTSTNGLAEYTASNFNDALKGDLLAAGLNGDLYKISLNEAGDDVFNLKGEKKINQDFPFASGFGGQPLDVTTQGDTDIFPGTVWAATYGANAVTIFEPQDFFICSGEYSTNLDEDGDGYSNADEIDNATNPCSAASKPADVDGDLMSDLNDPDDDNDGLGDNIDFFALDSNNGLTTHLPIRYDLFNNDPGTGLFGLGFTGLMSNQKPDNDYYEQFYEDNLIAGGAVGAFSVVAVSTGDALGALNNQENAFQFGVNVNSGTGPFTTHSRMLINFFDNKPPQDFQSQGLYIGVGDQDNYLKIELNANGGTPGIGVVYENAGVVTTAQYPLGGLPSVSLDFFLSVDPLTGTIQPKYAKNGASPIALGIPIAVSGALLNAIQNTPALAIGIISTSRGASPFTATWDFIHVTADPVTATGGWQNIVPTSGAPTARHEAAYVQAGDKFYLIGGRGIKPVQIYNPATKTWSNGASTPIELHHFQGVTLDGLIYVVGAFTGAYPSETPVPNIYIYNPVKNAWTVGPQIPVSRRRGSAGVVVYNNKIYLVSGITNGHNSGHVVWMDEYDPTTNSWTVLPDAPRARDHFHAAVIGNKLYAAAGRRTSASTGEEFTLTVPEVDIFDFVTKTWSTSPNNIPTQRAGNSIGVLGNELIVIGGESTEATVRNETEALNISNNTWRSLANMVQGRYGTQAIVNNNGIYVAAGSGGQGTPDLSVQEAFYMFSPTTPTGNALSESEVAAPASIEFGQVTVNTTHSKSIQLSNTMGSQAIVVSSISLSNSSDFTFSLPFTVPFIIPVGKSINIDVAFNPNSINTKSATLTISHSGLNEGTIVTLSGEGVILGEPLYMINAGGPAVTINGKTWDADQYFSNGSTFSNNYISDIANTTLDDLYKSERNSSSQQFTYSFPVPSAGTYKVNLHFAEIYWGATTGGVGGVGQRVFGVNVEGGAVELANYDIFAEVGAMTAVVKTYDVFVSDGMLNIVFTASVDQPKVSAIEVIPYIGEEIGYLTANPTSLHFFTEQVGTTSTPQTITLSNTGTASLDISGVTINGTNSNNFTHNFTSPVTVVVGGSVSVDITFTPASLGTKVANMDIVHTGSNSPFKTGLTGEGHDNANQSPIVSTAIGDQSATVGVAFSYSFGENTFSDGDGDVLSYTATLSDGSALPSWLSFTSGSRSFSGTPPVDASSLTVKITASDDKGGTVSDEFVISISGTVEPLYMINAGGPAVTINGKSWGADQYFSNGSTYSNNYISDIANTTLDDLYKSERNSSSQQFTYSFPVPSAGTYKVNLHFAEIYWGATTGGVGGVGQRVFGVNVEGGAVELANYDIFAEVGAMTAVVKTYDVFVSDGMLNIVFTASVDQPKVSAIEVILSQEIVNQSPVVLTPIGDQSATVGVAFSYSFGENTFSDGDGDVLSYTATLSDGSALPSWLSFTSGSRSFSGTPPVDASSLTVKITASDDKGGTVSDEFVISISGTVEPLYMINAGGPAVTINGKSWGADQYFSNGSTYSNNYISDIANTTLDDLYKSERNSSSQQFTYSFPVPSAGTYKVNLHFAEIYWGATTGGVGGVGQRVFGVNVEGGAVELANYDIFAEVGAMTAVVKTYDVFVSDGMLNIVFTASVDQPKVSAIEVILSQEIVNQSPVVLTPIGDQSATVGVAFSYSFGENTFSDGDGDVLSYTATLSDGSALPSWLSFTSGSRSFSGTPPVDASSLTVKITASDDKGGTVSDEFVISINAAPNQVPIADAGVNQMITLPTNSVILDGSASSDADGSITSYVWSKQSGPSATLSGALTATLTASDLVAGTYVFRLTVTDNDEATAFDEVTVTVNATPNQSPVVLTPIGDQSATVGVAFSYSFGENTFSDGDGDVLSYTATLSDGSALPSWLSFTSGSRSFSGTPPVDASSLTVKITASDDKGGTVSDEFVISINAAPNQVPIADAGVNQMITLPTNSVILDGSASSDADGSITSYVWSKQSGPSATLSGALTATLTASDLVAGTYVFRLTVTDNDEATAFDEVTVTVNATPNQSPVVLTPIGDQSATVGVAFSYSFGENTFSDGDGDVLSYTATLSDGSALPSWLSFTSGSRSFSGTPPSNNPASLTVKVTAADGKGGTVSDEFVISINAAPSGQSVVNFTLINADTEQAIKTIVEGEALNLATLPTKNLNIRANTNPVTVGSVVFALSGTQSRVQTETGAPYALFGDSKGNYNPWTPAVGAYTLMATPYTSAGGNGTKGTPLTLTFSVTNTGTPNQSPVVANLIPDQSATVGVAFSYSFGENTFSDGDGDVLSYTATLSDGSALPSWLSFTSGSRSFSGTPPSNNPASLTVKVTAADGKGGTVSDEFVISINAAPSGQSVVNFTLINADTEQAIKTIVEGEALNLATLPTKNLNIRANTNPVTVGSVVFALSGTQSRVQTETGAPYALFGDSKGNYNPWTPAVGAYTLMATPYTSAGGNGTKGTPLTLTFSVTNGIARIATTSDEISSEYEFSIYPNPFHGKTTVQFKSMQSDQCVLTLYNAQGAIVKVLMDGEAEMNKLYTFELDGNGLKSGVYMAQLITKDKVLYKQIILLN